jgi:hypothetical protein
MASNRRVSCRGNSEIYAQAIKLGEHFCVSDTIIRVVSFRLELAVQANAGSSSRSTNTWCNNSSRRCRRLKFFVKLSKQLSIIVLRADALYKR